MLQPVGTAAVVYGSFGINAFLSHPQPENGTLPHTPFCIRSASPFSFFAVLLHEVHPSVPPHEVQWTVLPLVAP